MSSKKGTEITSWEQTPPSGHEERFLAKLNNAMPVRGSRIMRFQVFTIAASIAVLIGISLTLIVRLNSFNNTRLMLSGVSPEYSETEQYFQQRIASRLEVLEEEAVIKRDLLAELDEMDNNLKTANKELQQNPGDERIVEAILMIYQTKLDLINDVVHRTK